MSQTKKHCEPLVAVWLRPSTTEPCICCKQVAEKPRGEHLKNDVVIVSFYWSITGWYHQQKDESLILLSMKVDN